MERVVTFVKKEYTKTWMKGEQQHNILTLICLCLFVNALLLLILFSAKFLKTTWTETRSENAAGHSENSDIQQEMLYW